MQETTYYVILFHRDGGDLIGAAPMMAESEIAAVGEAQRLAQKVAGAIVIGRFADSGRFEIIFRTGDLPDTLPDFAAI
jgi:hypothetical protein